VEQEQIGEPSDSEKVKLYNQKSVEWDPQGKIKNATGFVG
jgi:hypothetical protein